jgi:hypothetical protein
MTLRRWLALVFLASTTSACSTVTTGPTDAGSCTGRDSGVDGPTEPTDTGACSIEDTGTRSDVAKSGSECGAAKSDAGSPALVTLGVTGGLTLVPDFSPYVFDYYMQCSAGSNSVTVSVKAGPGMSSSLSVETPASPHGTSKSVGGAAPEQTVTVSLEEGQAIVATATEGTTQNEYWIRCLPEGFPPNMQWNSHSNGCERTPGYYLIGTMSSGSPGWAIVFDTNGVPVWYKGNAGAAVYDVETLVPGDISFFEGGWQNNQLGVSTLQPIVDGYEGGAPGTPDEHELRILSNGHYIALSSAAEPGVNLTGLSVPQLDGGLLTYGPNTTIYACYIQEFDPKTGQVYWQWSATDHFNPVKVMVLKGNGDLAETEAEPFHCNAIDVDPANGNLLVSARNTNSIFYIEKSTGKVLWKMGGAGLESCLDEPPPIYVPVADPFAGQHDARLQPGWKETCSGGSGQISLFDDESYSMNPARGVLYDVIVNNGSGCAGGTTGTTGATRIWDYATSENVPTQVCGGFRISSDGSRIIGWGQSDPSPNGLVFTEVDEKGNDLLDLICPDDSSSYRAVKVPLSAFDLSVLRSTSGQ